MSRFQRMFLTMIACLVAAAAGTRRRVRSLAVQGTTVTGSVAVLSLAGLLRTRLTALHEDERGDGGGNALTTVLLAVAGVLAVGAVVSGVGVAIAAALGKLG